MSRLIKLDDVGKQRDRLMKSVAFALRELAARQWVDDGTRDLVAYVALALNEVHDTLDVTCAAWEKRDYWVKADQFRREWAWAGRTGAKLEVALLGEMWADVAGLIPGLAQHMSKIKLPKRNTLGEPWHGAFERLKQVREVEE